MRCKNAHDGCHLFENNKVILEWHHQYLYKATYPA